MSFYEHRLLYRGLSRMPRLASSGPDANQKKTPQQEVDDLDKALSTAITTPQEKGVALKKLLNHDNCKPKTIAQLKLTGVTQVDLEPFMKSPDAKVSGRAFLLYSAITQRMIQFEFKKEKGDIKVAQGYCRRAVKFLCSRKVDNRITLNYYTDALNEFYNQGKAFSGKDGWQNLLSDSLKAIKKHHTPKDPTKEVMTADEETWNYFLQTALDSATKK